MLSQLNKFIVIVFIVFCFSCDNSSTVDERGEILFPGNNSTFIVNFPVTLKGSMDGDWISDRSGLLGTGKEITVILSPGKHNIHLRTDNTLSQEIVVNIRIPDSSKFVFNLFGASPEFFIPKGEYRTGYISFKEEKSKFDITLESFNSSRDKSDSFTYRGDLTLEPPAQKGYIYKSRNLSASDSNSGIFKLIDFTDNSFQKVVNIEASKIDSGSVYDLWIDSADTIDSEVLTSLRNTLPALLKDHEAVWGDREDINSDGKIAVLLSGKINSTGNIMGYFNPADFYVYNNDNPASNELDILYIAVPEINSAKYSLNGVIATISHELTHLKNYSRIYREEKASPNVKVEKEKVFLEEGFAHLAENLSGYGESGGNFAFLSRYLALSYETPLADLGMLNIPDTIEKRGGMALLLSWIFWKEGGMYNNGNEWIDSGGLSWLNRIKKSKYRGWEKIEKSLGCSRKEILLEFLESILTRSNWENIYHPDTNECMTLNPFIGNIKFQGISFELNGLAPLNTKNMEVFPYSIGSISTESVRADTRFTVNSKGDLNDISLIFISSE